MKKHGVKSLNLDKPVSTYLSNEIDPGGVDFVLPSQWDAVTGGELRHVFGHSGRSGQRRWTAPLYPGTFT